MGVRALVWVSLAFLLWLSLSALSWEDGLGLDPKSLAPEEEFVRVRGLSLHFVRRGQGPPVVLIHGFGGWTFSWRHNLDALAAEHEVFALDLPGFGLSDKPADYDYDYSLESQAETVLAFLDRFGLERVALVGVSMGGAVALEVALDRPERILKLVLIDSAGYAAFKLPGWAEALARLPISALLIRAFLPDEARIRRTLEWLYADPTKVTDEVVAGYHLPLKTRGAADALAAMVRHLRFEGLKGRIGQVEPPTLILWGERDRLLPVSHARRFHHEITRSKLVLLPGAGHMPNEEVPEEVNRELLDFLGS